MTSKTVGVRISDDTHRKLQETISNKGVSMSEHLLTLINSSLQDSVNTENQSKTVEPLVPEKLKKVEEKPEQIEVEFVDDQDDEKNKEEDDDPYT